MTEASDDGNYLVRVRAQVMTRDDSSGGWVPLSGGGLANVSVRRRAASATPPGSGNNTSCATNTTTCGSSPNNNNPGTGQGSSSTSPPGPTIKRRHEYLIYGKRITDQSVVLSCTIKKDFQYNKVMPTFHHWRTGDKKFGLTFQTAADARAFDKGVRTAVEELLEGLSDTNLHGCGHIDAGDEGVFMTVNLPAEPPDPRQSSTEPSRVGGGVVRGIPSYHHSQSGEILDSHKSSIHCISSGPTAKQHHPLESSGGEVGVDNYPYVQLTTLNHDYLYPVIEDHKGANTTERRTSSGSLKKPDIIVSQPGKNNPAAGNIAANCRLRCKHCQQTYTERDNSRGACEYGPDFVGKGISTISCLLCAKCMLYHCMSDAEGENSQNIEQNPCSCSTEEGCGRRWFSLALLSLIVPCLWLYPPLRAMHWCGVTCGICGGRHHPME